MRLSCLAALATVLLACSSARTRQVDALMQSPVVPASDAIFNAVIYTNGRLAASPQTDADWERLRQHASSLAGVATALRTLAPPDDPAEWITQSDALGAASAAALQALNARDLDGVLQAGSLIYDTCTSCHAAYVKDN